MQIKRAIGMSILTYIASFIVGTVVALSTGINLGETQEIPPLLWYTGAITAIIFAAAFAFWYFRSPKTRPSVKEGFQLGIVMILTGFALDFISFIPLLQHEDPFGPILEYYMAPLFWITLLLVIGATTLTGMYLENKRRGGPMKKQPQA